MGASGSSDVQIFNHSKLKGRIENGTLGLIPPEPLGQNCQLQDIHGEKAGQELIWYTGQVIQSAVDHHGTEAKSCDRHCVNMCGTT